MSFRFWLTLLALGGLALLTVFVFQGKSPLPGVPSSSGATPLGHRIDLVAMIAQATSASGFAMANGVTTTDLAVQLDATRTMVVKAGTPGSVACPELDQPARCAIAADLLGDAVVWFSIVPGSLSATLSLPAVTSLPEAGWVQLANGWIVRRSSAVERACATDTSSLTDFVRTFGERATSTFNLEIQRVVKVGCANGGVVTTDSVAPPVDTGVVGTDNGTNEGDSTAPSTP